MQMNNQYMSQRTADLMVMMLGDGVDPEELRALVDSAFCDGLESLADDGDPGESGQE